jgi:hypothetical protein
MAEAGLVGEVHGGLLGTGSASVDPDVRGDQVRLVIAVRALVRRDEAAGPRERHPAVVARFVLVGPGVVRSGVRLLLGEQAVQALALLLLGECGAEAGRAGPAGRGVDPGVQHVGVEPVAAQ